MGQSASNTSVPLTKDGYPLVDVVDAVDVADVDPIPGFGFYSTEWSNQFHSLVNDLGLSVINNTERRNSAMCQVVDYLWQQQNRSDDAPHCSPLWDNASCFPATPEGTVRVIPCMKEFSGVVFGSAGKGNQLV